MEMQERLVNDDQAPSDEPQSPADDQKKTEKPEKVSTYNGNKILDLVTSVLFGPEVPMALYFVTLGIFMPAQQQFVYRRLCLYHYDSTEICDNIDKLPELAAEEAFVQSAYSHFATIFQLASYAPVLFVAFILGTWCDRFSYRVPMVMSHLFFALVTLFYVLFAFLPNQAINPTYLALVSLIGGLSGQNNAVTMAVVSYVTKKVPPGKSRTIHVAAVEAAFLFGEMIGALIFTFAFKGGKNYVTAFMVQMAINLYAAVYVWFLVPELVPFKTVKERVRAEANGSWFHYLFSFKANILSAFEIFKREKQQRSEEAHRWFLVMLLTFASIAFATGSKAITQVTYAYLTLQPISFSPSKIALFQAVWTGLMGVSLFAVVRILRLKLPPILPFSDAALGVFGISTRIVALIVFGLGAFYPESCAWIFCVVNMFSVFVYVSLRTGVALLTSKNQHGRLFSVICLCENLFGMVAGIAFNALYGALVKSPTPWVHGYIFFFIAGLALIPTITFTWLGKQPIKGWSFHSSQKFAQSDQNQVQQHE